MKINDAHNDFLLEISTLQERNTYIKSLIKNKDIKKVCSVVWTSKLISPNNKIIFFNNIVKNKKFNKKLYMCIEDLGFINKTNFKETIQLLVKIKPLYCGLVWNYKNKLGGGAYTKNAMSLLGKKIVNILENHKIIIDTAHMNKRTFNNFSKITKFPILNSHTNFSFIKNHIRNINENQIKTIINSNGFIGLCFVNKFANDKLIDSSYIAKELAIFVRKYGENNIGIGTDFYGTKDLPRDLKNYNDIKMLKKFLKKEGLTKKIINKIFYKNFENYIKRINNFYCKK